MTLFEKFKFCILWNSWHFWIFFFLKKYYLMYNNNLTFRLEINLFLWSKMEKKRNWYNFLLVCSLKISKNLLNMLICKIIKVYLILSATPWNFTIICTLTYLYLIVVWINHIYISRKIFFSKLLGYSLTLMPKIIH